MSSHDLSGADDRRRGMCLSFVAAAVSGVAVFINSYGVRAFPDPTAYTTAKNLVVTGWTVTGMLVVVLGAGLASWAGRDRSAREVVAT